MVCGRSAAEAAPNAETAPQHGGEMTQYNMPPQGQPPSGQPPYGQPSYGQPPPYGQPAPSSGMAIGSLVTGILSIPACCAWFVSIPLGLCGVILGFVAKGKIARGQATGSGMATAGIITGAVGLLLSIGLNVAILIGGKDLENKLKFYQHQAEQQRQQQQQQGNP
jgi:hypothetical protein